MKSSNAKRKIPKFTSPPARVVWIEIVSVSNGGTGKTRSPPARVVWIEISMAKPSMSQYIRVATREGGVD